MILILGSFVGWAPGAHITKNSNYLNSHFHQKVRIYPNFSNGNERKLR